MDFSAKLSLPYLLPNQAEKHVTLNESLRRLDAIVQLSVVSASTATAPDAPDDGDRYLVPEGAADDWAGQALKLASYQDGGWQYYQAQSGWTAWIEDEARLVVFDGAAWTGAASGVSDPDQLGINATADDTNRLALASPASLFNHEGAGHQLKVNKASEADTASLLFQSNWQGAAEIGLVGNNDLDVKVSSDGQTFVSALHVRASDQAVGIGTQAPTAHLHVEGAVRVLAADPDDLPSAAAVGIGALAVVTSFSIYPQLAYSDGTVWRSVKSNAVVSRV